MLDLRAKLAISNTPELLELTLESVISFIQDTSDQLKKIGIIHSALEVTKPNSQIGLFNIMMIYSRSQ